jgi:hypothetical protein
LSIRADGRIRTNAGSGFQRLQEIARQIIETEEEGDDYTIITKDNQRITPKELILQKTLSLPAAGKSVSRQPTWDELQTFFNELCADHRIVAP